MNDVANLPQKLGEMKAGGVIKPIIPQSMDDAYRLAKAVCMSGLAPKGLDKPEAAMVAILHGMEIGLTPMMALQKIAVVNGRPTIWGDGALGLVRGSGLCEYVKEWIEGQGDNLTAWCETRRRGEREPIKRAFSVADAKRAGLWGKSGTWQSFPNRMLAMRARGFALRDGFADVLGGMYLAEELQGSEPANGLRDITPPPVPPAPPPVPKPAAVAPGALDPHAHFTAPIPPHDPDTGELSDAPETLENYPARIDEWEARLKRAEPAEQGEIWEAEIQPWIERGVILAPDRQRLERLVKDA